MDSQLRRQNVLEKLPLTPDTQKPLFSLKQPSVGLWLSLFISSVLSVHACADDKIYLRNGDTLSGNIQSLEAGKLALKTVYAGTVNISWKQVKTIDTESPLWITFVGEKKPRKRTLRHYEKQQAIVESDGKQHVFSAVWPLASISRKPPVISDKWKISGDVRANMNSSTGNDDEILFSFDGTLDISDQLNKNILKWDVELEHDKDKEDEQNSSEWELGYTYQRYLTEHWFVKGSAKQSEDSSADLKSRTVLSPGMGYRFWETSKRKLLLSGGPSYIWENYDNVPNQDHYAVNLELYFLTPIYQDLSYYLDTKFFYGLGGDRQDLMDMEHGLTAQITKTLSLSLSHYLDYDSTPAGDAKKLDNQVKFGVGYKW